MSHHLSLSRWGLAKQCSYWCRPDIQLPRDESGKPARVGTITHRLSDGYAKALIAGASREQAEASILGSEAPAPGEAYDEWQEATIIYGGPLSEWIEGWVEQPGKKHTELRLRYSARTDRVHQAPRRDEPGYTRPGPFEVSGELDFVRVVDGVAEVIDLKTGKVSESAIEQLNAYAVLASRFFGVSHARHRVLYARKTKLIETPWVEMDADALDAEAGAIGRVLRRLPTVQPTKPADSKVCAFICPLGRAACPAHDDRAAYSTMPGDEYFGDVA